jgi:adenosylcobyric acid synthase
VKDLEHGGNVRQLAQVAGIPEQKILDFSANINPLGPPEWLPALISSQVRALQHYPDPHCTALGESVAQRYGVSRDEVIAGNGSTEILYLLARAAKRSHALIPVPSYGDYAKAAVQAEMQIQTIPADQELLRDSLTADTLVLLGRPNNPTGTVCRADRLRTLAAAHPDTLFMVDEAFGNFVENFDSLTRLRPANVIVLLSLTKIFAIPGLRTGCAIGDRGLIQRLLELQPPWSVNTLAQAVSAAALRDREYVRRTRAYVTRERQKLFTQLSSLPELTAYPGEANFLLVRLEGGMDAPALAERMLAHGIAIRVCTSFHGLDERHFRVAVRTSEENARLMTALRNVLDTRCAPRTKRAPAEIEFSGAGSDAGNLVLTGSLSAAQEDDV